MARTFKPTQPIAVLPGQPVGVTDMIMYFVQREDRGVTGFVRTESQYEPANMQREVTVNRHTAMARHWGLSSIIA